MDAPHHAAERQAGGRGLDCAHVAQRATVTVVMAMGSQCIQSCHRKQIWHCAICIAAGNIAIGMAIKGTSAFFTNLVLPLSVSLFSLLAHHVSRTMTPSHGWRSWHQTKTTTTTTTTTTATTVT